MDRGSGVFIKYGVAARGLYVLQLCQCTVGR